MCRDNIEPIDMVGSFLPEWIAGGLPVAEIMYSMNNSRELINLRKWSDAELFRILDFWSSVAVDHAHGGFIGAMGYDGSVVKNAPKGAVLNMRILWTFSAAARYTGKTRWREVADYAYNYCRDHFLDRKNGGIFWTVDPSGEGLNRRKQIYALAFGVYAFSEYIKISNSVEAMNHCNALFNWIEKISFDAENNGYREAFSHDGHLLEDMRLSEKDRNDPKSMNTHLHLLEAYTNLYRICDNAAVRERLLNLIDLFMTTIISPETSHLNLFFTDEWKVTTEAVSYGHDIEASWLLLEAAEATGDDALIASVRKRCRAIADAATDGLQHDGSLIHEYDPATRISVTNREWWVSAEAIVGFLNAYQMSGHSVYIEKAINVWEFISVYLIDRSVGEWRWGVDERMEPVGNDKISMWKGPYHNSRACLEIRKRCSAILKTGYSGMKNPVGHLE